MEIAITDDGNSSPKVASVANEDVYSDRNSGWTSFKRPVVWK